MLENLWQDLKILKSSSLNHFEKNGQMLHNTGVQSSYESYPRRLTAVITAKVFLRGVNTYLIKLLGMDQHMQNGYLEENVCVSCN